MSWPGTSRLRRHLLWGALGVCAYLGAALFLLTGMMPLVSDSGIEMEAMGPFNAGAVFISLLLFILGGYAIRQVRGAIEPMRPQADDLPAAYRSVPPESSNGTEEDTDTGGITCANCGAANDSFYTYCSECNEKL